jgi:hypothetical protein
MTKMTNAKRAFSALAALMLLAAGAQAGTQGRVSGKVTDSAGNPIDGVTVTVTTPSIKTFKLSVKTDKQGQYGLIVNDATIRYQLKFEKEGFVPAETEKKFSTVEVTVVVQRLLKPSEGGAAKGAAKSAPVLKAPRTVPDDHGGSVETPYHWRRHSQRQRLTAV